MYNCTATNQATGLKYHAAEQGSYVRVKGTASINKSSWSIYLEMTKILQSFFLTFVVGKLAALWPFLGICAEVFILCAIILVYEKRRNKADLDESDTDQSPEQ